MYIREKHHSIKWICFDWVDLQLQYLLLIDRVELTNLKAIAHNILLYKYFPLYHRKDQQNFFLTPVNDHN